MAEDKIGLSTLELVSKLFGWWSMGLAIVLFLPEIIEAVTKRPKERPQPGYFPQSSTYVDVLCGLVLHAGDRVGWFERPQLSRDQVLNLLSSPPKQWLWLAGDGGQLIGLYLANGLETQKALCWSIASADIIMIFLLSTFAGLFVCRPCRTAREKKRKIRHEGAEKRVISHLVAQTLLAPDDPEPIKINAQLPPGYTTMGDQIARRFKNGLAKARKQMVNVAIVVVTLLVMSMVFLGKDYLFKDTKKPDPISHMPENQEEWIAYILSYAAIPRGINIYNSRKYRRPEGITTSAVIIGGLSHVANIASIMTVNHERDSVIAQLPFVLTAVCCALIDCYRLILKNQLRDAVPKAKNPWKDPNWRQQQLKRQEKHRTLLPDPDHSSDFSESAHSASDSEDEVHHGGRHRYGESSSSEEDERDQRDRLRGMLPSLPYDKRFDKNHPANVARIKKNEERRAARDENRRHDAKEFERIKDEIESSQKSALKKELDLEHHRATYSEDKYNRIVAELNDKAHREAFLLRRMKQNVKEIQRRDPKLVHPKGYGPEGDSKMPQEDDNNPVFALTARFEQDQRASEAVNSLEYMRHHRRKGYPEKGNLGHGGDPDWRGEEPTVARSGGRQERRMAELGMRQRSTSRPASRSRSRNGSRNRDMEWV
ncbi:hypothetical protein JCM11641_005211 [Rhodosporidiobolus odoratus]